jgi:murein DD-endopeptidase MepM/ murein hydrolase activator NlpD
MFLCMATAATLLLGGLMPESTELETRWPLAGRWQFPVGDPCDFSRGVDPGQRGYSVTRNVGGPSRHLGADLSNRQAGALVRAAAHGVVVVAGTTGDGGGYGLHVVLAHRLPDGEVVFSVYAHLAPGTIMVKAGNRALLGEPLGRVGATGDATAPHLHFEVRTPADPWQRWEKAEAVDPVAFVRARLPEARSDTSWVRPYLDWSEAAGLVRGPAGPGDPVRRGEWRRMLVVALPSIPGTGPDSLDATTLLRARGVLAPDCRLDPLDTVTWSEVAADIVNAVKGGVRLPPCTVEPARHHDLCRHRLSCRSPAASLGRIARRHDSPSLAEICLLLADLTFE